MKIAIGIVVGLLIASNVVLAGGDKNRGDKGQGKVHQEQVRNK